MDIGEVCRQMQFNKRVIGISGMPGAGKGVVANSASQRGLEVFVLGDVIREETERRGLEPTPKNVGAVMLQLREEEGSATVARRLSPKIEASSSIAVIVEGIRSLDELTELRTKYEVVTVAIHASPETRFRRLLSRGRSDDPKDMATFNERDIRELKVGLGEVIALADIVLVNEGSINELQTSFKKVLTKLNQR